MKKALCDNIPPISWCVRKFDILTWLVTRQLTHFFCSTFSPQSCKRRKKICLQVPFWLPITQLDSNNTSTVQSMLDIVLVQSKLDIRISLVSSKCILISNVILISSGVVWKFDFWSAAKCSLMPRDISVSGNTVEAG